MLELRPYQKADVNKLRPLNAVAILNQQRTGKTPTSLILCQAWECKKPLIVCPGSMLYKWKREFENWLKLPCIVLDGTPTQRAKKLEQWTYNIGLCITYGTLKLINRTDKETGRIKKTGELLNIIKQHPDCVIVDEWHRARNPKTLTAKSLLKLSDYVPKRIALTGTPTYGKDLDIYTLIKFLYPDKVGTYTQFKEKHCLFTPVFVPGKGQIFKPSGIKPESTAKIQRFLSKIAVQRKQQDPEVMPWLPDKPIPEIIALPLSPLQQKMLNELEKYFETDNIIVQGILDRIIRYRQILNEPNLLGNMTTLSPKTNWILGYLEDYMESPTIFFSNFTSYLKLLETYLKTRFPDLKYALIVGETPLEIRDQLVQKFQNGELDFLFINIQTGKEGLTLDRAETLVFIDQYPPAGDIDQAIERLTATTPERAQIPKRVIKLMMENSLEEEIENAIQEGLNMTEAYNSFVKYLNL